MVPDTCVYHTMKIGTDTHRTLADLIASGTILLLHVATLQGCLSWSRSHWGADTRRSYVPARYKWTYQWPTGLMNDILVLTSFSNHRLPPTHSHSSWCPFRVEIHHAIVKRIYVDVDRPRFQEKKLYNRFYRPPGAIFEWFRNFLHLSRYLFYYGMMYFSTKGTTRKITVGRGKAMIRETR